MGTVPVVPAGKPPIGKTMPIVLVLTGAVVLIGASTAYNIVTGSDHKKEAAKSSLQARPSTADTQQVSNFQKQQELIRKSDADHAQLQQAMAAMQAQERGMQAQEQAVLPPPEADGTAPMTPAQSAAIYGNSPECPPADIRANRSARTGQAKGGRTRETAARRSQQRYRCNRLSDARSERCRAVGLPCANGDRSLSHC